jgi:cellulose synthase/poly-beta-1,6-N-acetylglucosamine synthase-like glycosyltransferase
MTFLLYAALLIALAYPVFLLWCRIGWTRTSLTLPDSGVVEPGTTAVSVILPVRNEELFIRLALNDLFEQSYPGENFEVIVVNDNSTDDTLKAVEDFFKEHPEFHPIKVINLPAETGGSKKAAITEGIKNAKNPLILITDADTHRMKDWIGSVVRYYEHYDPLLICGPVVVEVASGWFHKFQHLELAGLMVITGGAIQNGQPVLCNGANITFPKKIFEQVNGYADDRHASGDDTSLLNKIAAIDPGRIVFMKDPSTSVCTVAQMGIKDLLNQRKRWASKIPAMNPLAAFIAISAVVYHALIVVLAISALLGGGYKLLLLLFGVKLFAEFLVLESATSFLNSRKLLRLFLPAQIFYPFYLIIVGIGSQFGKYEWKGRKISIDN